MILIILKIDDHDNDNTLNRQEARRALAEPTFCQPLPVRLSMRASQIPMSGNDNDEIYDDDHVDDECQFIVWSIS